MNPDDETAPFRSDAVVAWLLRRRALGIADSRLRASLDERLPALLTGRLDDATGATDREATDTARILAAVQEMMDPAYLATRDITSSHTNRAISHLPPTSRRIHDRLCASIDAWTELTGDGSIPKPNLSMVHAVVLHSLGERTLDSIAEHEPRFVEENPEFGLARRLAACQAQGYRIPHVVTGSALAPQLVYLEGGWKDATADSVKVLVDCDHDKLPFFYENAPRFPDLVAQARAAGVGLVRCVVHAPDESQRQSSVDAVADRLERELTALALVHGDLDVSVSSDAQPFITEVDRRFAALGVRSPLRVSTRATPGRTPGLPGGPRWSPDRARQRGRHVDPPARRRGVGQ